MLFFVPTTLLHSASYPELRNTPYQIPQDIAVVGFSNEPFSEVVTPSISTIKQPGYEMGD
jgi:DNA-binding LacI/PurR family transcriptional regulator